MKVILLDNRRLVLRFDKGEEVFKSLKKFLQGQNITASAFSGIGACDLAELSVYDKASKSYQTQIFREQCEILSIIGNSAIKDGEVALHAHAVLSKSDFSAIGGHVVKLVISATCELFLIKLNGKMERKLDLETNLNLLV